MIGLFHGHPMTTLMFMLTLEEDEESYSTLLSELYAYVAGLAPETLVLKADHFDTCFALIVQTIRWYSETESTSTQYLDTRCERCA